jgi:hypothetical protein
MSSYRAITKSFVIKVHEDVLKELETRLERGEITQKIYDYMAQLLIKLQDDE